ncbi:hypothetical protein [Staphylococcus shinii]|uniref:hypothetical protein n=1 Tax=Staphylococcus shinii TaxID=2912228 RepID=UPI001304884E|nr:hypothetical protein [Staphylococcus shinii]
METSVLIPTNDMSRHANEIVETMPENELNAFNSFKYHRSSSSYHLALLLILKSSHY